MQEKLSKLISKLLDRKSVRPLEGRSKEKQEFSLGQSAFFLALNKDEFELVSYASEKVVFSFKDAELLDKINNYELKILDQQADELLKAVEEAEKNDRKEEERKAKKAEKKARKSK